MRRGIFYQGGFYHIYNRGVDGRQVFCDTRDYERFLLSLNVFNQVELVGSIREYTKHHKSDFWSSRSRTYGDRKKSLVDLVAYCLLPNHYHLIIK